MHGLGTALLRCWRTGSLAKRMQLLKQQPVGSTAFTDSRMGMPLVLAAPPG
jgi:hypothetical protein